jgi:hypothetical protein
MTISLSLRQNQSTDLTWAQVDGNFIALAGAIGVNGGSTAQRPVSPLLYQSYFDTTLGIPIVCSQITPSVIWVNFAGVPV